MKLLFAALLLAAGLSALVGQGGGVLYTPLQLWAGIPFQQAAATSLVLIVAVSLSSALVYRSARRVDWGLVLIVEPPTMLGGFAGGFVSHVVPGRVLELVLGCVLVLMAPLLLRTPRVPRRIGRRFSMAPAGSSHRGRSAVLLLMFGVGVLTGALGIGGGVLKVPVMMLLMGVPTETAIGSSAVMVGLTATAGVAGHVSVGHVPWRIALVLAAAVFLGAGVGSRISLTFSSAALRRVLAGVQLVVGGLVLAQAVR